jgi:serine/threonine protein kinase
MTMPIIDLKNPVAVTVLYQPSPRYSWLLAERESKDYYSLPRSLPPTFQTQDRSSDLTILNLLGEGSFGAVYKAEHKASSAEVAVKIIPTNDAEFDKIKGKIDILSRCDSPYVVLGWGPPRIPHRHGHFSLRDRFAVSSHCKTSSRVYARTLFLDSTGFRGCELECS